MVDPETPPVWYVSLNLTIEIMINSIILLHSTPFPLPLYLNSFPRMVFVEVPGLDPDLAIVHPPPPRSRRDHGLQRTFPGRLFFLFSITFP